MRVFPRRLNRPSLDTELRNLEDKCRLLGEATEKWRTVLRDMELKGESSDVRYERYLEAYVKAKQQEKHADLQLFNLRQGLST